MDQNNKSLETENLVNEFESFTMLEKGFLSGCLLKAGAPANKCQPGLLPFISKLEALKALLKDVQPSNDRADWDVRRNLIDKILAKYLKEEPANA